MDDQDFKMEVIQRLTKLETIITEKVKPCKYPEVNEKVKTNRRLIFLILASYIPLILGMYLMGA